jgi:Zn-dependent protease with chaperone function
MRDLRRLILGVAALVAAMPAACETVPITGRSRLPFVSSAEFLPTHPSDETRIRQIEGWLPEAERYDQGPG